LPQRVKDSSGNGYLSDIVTVEIGYSSNAVAVAVDKYGHVWTWGTEGQYGMLGIGTTNTVALLPVQVKDSSGTGYLSNIIQAEPNERHYGQAVAALAADGTV
jgi:alpha-tubulin suppressor-like RCC1 family protein